MEAGNSGEITHQIVINNQVAFEKGETLLIEAVSPGEQQPEYKYVVTSPWLGTKFQLSDADLVMVQAPQAADRYAPAPYAQQPQQTPPSGQPYPPMAPAGPVYQTKHFTPPVSRKKRGSLAGGFLGILMAGALIASTFLQWFGSRRIGTGWALMRDTSSLSGGGFTLAIHANGVVFLTGFFSLLFGALILIGALVMLFRRRIGGVLIFFFALLSTGAAVVDIVMVYSKMSPVTPGVGLWVFAGASLVALVLGFVGMVSAGG